MPWPVKRANRPAATHRRCSAPTSSRPSRGWPSLSFRPDAGGGSAVDAGAPEFIDLLCSQNDELAGIFRDGLAWLDTAMRRRERTPFVDAAPDRQTALLDALVAAERSGAPGGLGPGVSFFRWARRMTVDAYYTSPIGIADLQYQGNAVLTRFEVPREALDFVTRAIDEL